MTEPLLGLVTAIRAFLQDAAPSPEAKAEVAEILAVTDELTAPRVLPPHAASQAALTWLPPAGNGKLGEICALTRAASSLMPWHYSYNSGDGLAERIAFADLLGPSGPFISDHLRLGLTLVAPRTLYPMHAHPARELYCVVSGEALWTAGNVARRPKPGAFILHPSGIPHAMETDTTSLLAIYSWHGDIFTPPYYTNS
jgi:mannose-6-phosphate isomerase-like protein (cupin superfamily)